MATHDYVIDNGTGSAVRTDINNVLSAIVSNNSSSSEPSTKYAYQWWADTTTGILKIRNSSNNGWVELLQLDGTLTLEDGSNSTPGLAFRDDLNTGIFSSAADTFDISCGGTTRGSFSSSGLTVTGNVTATTFVGNVDAVDGDFDGTLEADAITVAGVALSTVIAGTTVTTATNANHVSVADNESTNENNLIPFIEDASATGNVGLESDGDFTYNPSTGLVTATAFSGSGASLTALNIVTDTSPQLGGDLQTNGNNIDFGDSGGASDDRAVFGADTDMQLYHTGSQGVLDNDTGALDINTTSDLRLNVQSIFKVLTKGGSENCIIGNTDGAVELYHDNIKRFETDGEGVRVVAPEGGHAVLRLIGDEGDDNNDYFRLKAGAGQLLLQDASNGSSWEDNIVINAAGSVELYHNNSKMFETTSTGFNSIDNLYFIRNSGTDQMLCIGTNNTATAQWSSTRQGIKLAGSNPVLYFHDTDNSREAYLGGANGGVYIGSTNNGMIRFQTGTGATTSNRWYLDGDGHFYPAATNSYDIGAANNRVRNIYTNDLHLSNKGHSNDVDGTWGNWTIQEGESDLFLKNNRSGKKYKFNLTEVS